MKWCIYCGKQIQSEDLFCPYCGQKLPKQKETPIEEQIRQGLEKQNRVSLDTAQIPPVNDIHYETRPEAVDLGATGNLYMAYDEAEDVRNPAYYTESMHDGRDDLDDEWDEADAIFDESDSGSKIPIVIGVLAAGIILGLGIFVALHFLSDTGSGTTATKTESTKEEEEEQETKSAKEPDDDPEDPIEAEEPEDDPEEEPEITEEPEGETSTASEETPFYGVWCGAYSSLENANEAAANLRAMGYPAQVVVSTDWQDMNPSTWYCVTAGNYDSQGAADAVLSQLQGEYPDAYVKYTGSYIGD